VSGNDAGRHMPRRRRIGVATGDQSMNETMSPAIQIEPRDGDDTVLCVLVAAR